MTASSETVAVVAAGASPKERPARRFRLGAARYFVQRLGFYLAAAWIAITLNFLLPRLMPGDPASALIAQMQGRSALSGEQIASIYRLFGAPGEPLWSQYVTYLGQVAHLDFGLSVAFFPTPVWDVISAGLPWTIGLVGITAVLSFVIGTAGGIMAGGRAGSRTDSVATPGAMFLNALPTFWIALLFVLVFGFQLAWLPTGGAYDGDLTPGLSMEFIGSVISHAALPALTIALGWSATWYIGMRNMMITTVSEDYVLLARAKGLGKSRVMFRYAARNAILPSVAGFAINIGNVVGGQLLVEAVFAYPGVGYLLYQSVASVDYPLMQALFLMVSLSVLAANFLADSVYGLIDPRAREGRA
ncbi:ABC transporter permease [Streptomyces sp. MZ04]|uniref:ABC transporter permease n=1 Tax=Streptomyces sp. MZ04 TaxID=2559236 RepID=UPI00107EC683|nr:ABC transporter permease [Streptomyces sp. MZ04]TGB13568.1 ABC transporter permease [Streptomyces sp. MZ04]